MPIRSKNIATSSMKSVLCSIPANARKTCPFVNDKLKLTLKTKSSAAGPCWRSLCMQCGAVEGYWGVFALLDKSRLPPTYPLWYLAVLLLYT